MSAAGVVPAGAAVVGDGDVAVAGAVLAREMESQHRDWSWSWGQNWDWDFCFWSWARGGKCTSRLSSSWCSDHRRETRDHRPIFPCDTARTPAACHCGGEEASRKGTRAEGRSSAGEPILASRLSSWDLWMASDLDLWAPWCFSGFFFCFFFVSGLGLSCTPPLIQAILISQRARATV